MQSFLKTSPLLIATAIVMSGCTIDRPARSDGEGPVIEMTFTGGAEFVISDTTRRLTAADNCGIVRDVNGGTVNNRSVDVAIAMVDQSGMARFRVTVEGEGIRPSSVEVIPNTNPLVGPRFTRDVDTIDLTFLATGDGVLNGGLLRFAIDSPFTPGVTISAVGTDTFGNETTFAPFELVSALATGICTY
jgi:hypothetical protein